MKKIGINSPNGVNYAALMKGLFVMKIVLFLILASTFNLLATGTYSQTTRMSLSLNQTSIKQVLKEIERSSEFHFLYNNDLIDVERKVDIQVDNEMISSILDKLFDSKETKYAVYDKQIVISPAGIPFPQEAQRKISGKVTDISGIGVPGASVVVKGLTVGIVTDSEGKFTLLIPSNAMSLVFSFVGMQSQEIAIGSKINYNVVLTEVTTGIEEVVAIGYGTVKKKDLTGSVGSLGAKELKDMVVTRIEQALSGKAAGVQVKTVSGEPGVAPQIRIRGIGSISAGVEPLYVIDGFPTDNLQTINSNDIESLDILKDASATAIYGSRGSNGVVIINTKRGKTGKATYTFDYYYGMQKVLLLRETMNAREQAQYYYDGLKNRNIDNGYDVSGPPDKWKIIVPQTPLDVLSGKNTIDRNMFSDVLRTAPMTQYQLTASGGNESVKYSLSGEYLDQDGIVIGSGFKRYSLRSNIDVQLSKKLSVKVSLNPAFTDSKLVQTTGGSGGATEGIISQATVAQPFYPLFNPDGSYFIFVAGMDAGPTGYNPVALGREVTNNQQEFSLLGNINAKYSFTDYLNLSIMFGTNLQSRKHMYFKPNLPVFLDQLATGTDDAFMRYNWLSEYTLNYSRSFGKHNLAGLIGFMSQKDKISSNSLTSSAYPNNLVPTLSAVSGIISSGTSDVSEWALVSYLARVNYNYNSKYYVTASYRMDGSSRFGTLNKYGTFPSMALAWRISQEKFLKDMTFLSDMKIRLSYGETGNNNIGNYDQYATITYTKYPIANVANPGFQPARLANPVLTWEKQKQLNVGIDFGFFKDRLVLNLDHFQSRNTDLLLNVNVPDITGFSTSLQNLGEVKNIGWEFTVKTLNFTGKFQWSTDFNISTYRNEVVKLGPKGDPIYVGGNVTMIGQPIGMFYGWLTDGIFMNQAELDKGPIFSPGTLSRSRLGDIRFVDVSGPKGVPDGIIDLNDKTIMGSPYPDFYYGMSNNFSYHNFSLNISLQGSQGNKVLFYEGGGALSLRGRIPAMKFLINYWKSEADPGDGKTPRPNDVATGNARGTYSQFWLFDGSYLRINNISLSYLLPDKISKKLRLSSTRVYINSNSPFIFTKYPNFNPDVSNTGNPLQPGNDSNNYPIPKSVAIGINLTF